MNSCPESNGFACRKPNGSLLPTHKGARSELYCPFCQFERKRQGCLFAPRQHDASAFGRKQGMPPPRAKKRRGGNLGISDSQAKPRVTDEELIQLLVDIYREKKGPPVTADVGGKRSTITRRFFGFANARQLAYERLEPHEQAEYVWRCQYCGKDSFQDPHGLMSHERHCRKKAGKVTTDG